MTKNQFLEKYGNETVQLSRIYKHTATYHSPELGIFCSVTIDYRDDLYGTETIYSLSNLDDFKFGIQKPQVDNDEKNEGASETSDDIVNVAKQYAINNHKETNHQYDGEPYEIHLQMVVDYANKYSSLLETDRERQLAISAAWCHDLIEDCRLTYNDVKNVLGIEVAEIVYALSNEKGRNRSERANYAYYQGIVNTPLATFVKLCDRLANISYSIGKNNSRMLEIYRKEHYDFKQKLANTGDSYQYAPMWDELGHLLML